jgi:hypothetical protein
VSACEPLGAAVVILQFKTTYLLSEITDTVQQKIATAITNVLGVDTKAIALTFSEIDIQGRQLLQLKGVLVDVVLLGFQGSPSEFASRLTDKNINLQMQALGLRSVLVMAPKSKQANSSGTITNSSDSSMAPLNTLPIGGIVGGVVGGVFFIAIAGGAYILLNQKRQKTVPVS